MPGEVFKDKEGTELKNVTLLVGRTIFSSSAEGRRNDWLVARITKAQVARCAEVRKVGMVTAKEGSMRHYQMPVTEAIMLKAED